MTGVQDQTGVEIREGDTILFSGRQFKVVFLKESTPYGRMEHRASNLSGEHLYKSNGKGHNGFYAEETLNADTDEPSIHRILLIAIDPQQMKVV